ncbi:hypothetical protein FRB96_008313 [Tulasnella sp. 330]|nr:hypothetical protein FRB96_008313 [Tulasnella sp. 330]
MDPPQHSSPSSSSSFSNSSQRSSSPSPSLVSQWDTHSSSSVTTDRAMTPKPTSTAAPNDQQQKQQALSASQDVPRERFLLIGTISKKATDDQLKHAFSNLSHLLGIYVRFVSQNGVVILAFHDSRACLKAHLDVLPAMRWESGDAMDLVQGGKVTSQLMSASALREVIGSSPFIADAEARIFVKAEAFLNGKILRDVLSDYGDVCTFEPVGQEGMLYSCEYFDARHARAAVKGLHSNSSALGVPLQVILQSQPPESLAIPHLPIQYHPQPLSHMASTTPILTSTTPLSQHQHQYEPNYSCFPPTPTTPHSANAPVDKDDDDDEVVMKVAERKTMIGVRRATRFVSFAASPSTFTSPRRVTPTVPTPSSPPLHFEDFTPSARARRSSTGSRFIPGETTQFALDKFRAVRASASSSEARVGLCSSELSTPTIPSTSPTLSRPAGIAVTPSTPSTSDMSLSAKAHEMSLGLGLHGMCSLAGLGLQVKETSAGLALVKDGSRKQRVLEAKHEEPSTEPRPECYYNSNDSTHHETSYTSPISSLPVHTTGIDGGINMVSTPLNYQQQQHYQHTALLPSSAPPYALPSPMPGHIVPMPWAQPFGGWRGVGMAMDMPSPLSPTTPSSSGMDPAMWMRRGSVPVLGIPYPKLSLYSSPEPPLANPTTKSRGLPRHRNNSVSQASRSPHHPSSTPSSPFTARLPLNARMSNHNHDSASSPTGSYQPPHHAPTAFDTAGPRNGIDLEKIAAGLDTRTTVMIKNVPSRMTHEDMYRFVNKTCDREFDFLYLRMDFVTGNNVGYAFVNFIEVGSLLKFLRENLFKRWNVYQSEKTMYAAYATYQGKAALVTKFQNSSILDRDMDVQPHIYYSSGDMKGLPEPFPAPNDSARKARSMAAAQEHGLYSRMNLAARQQMSMSIAAKASSTSTPSSSPKTPNSVRSRLSSDHSSNNSPNTPTSGSTPLSPGVGTAFGTPFFSGRGSSAPRAASFGRQPAPFVETPTRMGRKPRMST